MLLLATWYQRKPTLRRRYQFIRPIVKPPTPPLSSPITWSRRLSSANASVVILEVFVLIFLHWRLRRHCRFLGSVVDPPLPPSLSPIPRTRCLFFVLRWRLHCCCWVLGTGSLRWRHRRCQFPGTVNTLPPPTSETFTQAHSLLYFLHLCLYCFHRVLVIIFIYRRLCCCCQLLRPVIAIPQPLLLSPNPLQLCCRLRSLGRVIYSSSSADASIVVVNSAGQSAWHRQLSPSCRYLRRIVSNSFPPTPLLSLPIPRYLDPVFRFQRWRFGASH